MCAEDELMHNVNLTEDLCSGIFQYVFTVLIIQYSSCLSEAHCPHPGTGKLSATLHDVTTDFANLVCKSQDFPPLCLLKTLLLQPL